MFNPEDLKHLEADVSATSDQILTPFFQHTTARLKADGSIVTEADLKMQSGLRGILDKFAPGVHLLGEEMDAADQQKIIDSGSAYWSLDPLDGTNNFHHGVPLFSVSIALISDHRISLGMVYDPVRKEMFSATKGNGFHINGQRHNMAEQPAQLSHCLASVDFKRLKMPLKERLIRHTPFKSQRNAGSCALEWAWLAAGRLQLLLHGGEKLWDYAAGALLTAEAGGKSCGFDGEPVFNNSLDNRPVVGASNESLHQAWLEFLLGGD